MYVKLRKALSICDTWPAFLVINSSYIDSHCGGIDRILPSDARGFDFDLEVEAAGRFVEDEAITSGCASEGRG